jgi:hypothetical protein
MIELISDFQEVAVTKLMLDVFVILLENDNIVYRNFLKNNMYIPPELQEDKFLPICDDDDQIIFTSHTTVMSEKLMLDEIEKHEKKQHRWLPSSFKFWKTTNEADSE